MKNRIKKAQVARKQKQTALSSYDRLKAENEKLVKEKSLTETKINNLKVTIAKLEAEKTSLKNINVNMSLELEDAIKELSKVKPQEIKETKEVIESYRSAMFGPTPVTASSLKEKRSTVEKNKEESIRNFNDELKSVDVEIEKYVLNLDNEKNILTK